MECVHTWKNALQSKGERFDSFAFLLLQPASRRVEARGGGVHRRRVRNTRFSLVLTSVAGLPVLLLAIESPIPGIGRDGAEEKKKERRVAGKKCLGRWTRAKNAGCEVVKEGARNVLRGRAAKALALLALLHGSVQRSCLTVKLVCIQSTRQSHMHTTWMGQASRQASKQTIFKACLLHLKPQLLYSGISSIDLGKYASFS